MNKAITVKSEFLWFLFNEFEFLIVMCSELQCQKGILSLAFYCFEEKKDLGTGNIILILNIATFFRGYHSLSLKFWIKLDRNFAPWSFYYEHVKIVDPIVWWNFVEHLTLA